MTATNFGARMREWRRTRGLSQLDLAARAGVSQRHISFIETGRSRPSREMVVHLGRFLDIPPREQNLLLTSAGHAPAFSETPLDQLHEIAGVLDFMLTAHAPNMAIVVDRQWNVIRDQRPGYVVRFAGVANATRVGSASQRDESQLPSRRGAEALIAGDPEIYFTTPHFNGHPAVLVRLERIPSDQLEEAIVESWLHQAPKRVTRAWLQEHAGDRPASS